MRLFLTLKWWQLLIIMAILLFIQATISSTLFFSRYSLIRLTYVLAISWYYFFFFAWLCSVGYIIGKNIKDLLVVKYKRFKIVAYLLGGYLLLNLLPLLSHQINASWFDLFGYGKVLILILFLYLIYIVATIIRVAELKEVPPLADLFIDIILILMFPIVLWILQPRINQLVEENKQLEINDHLLE